MLRSPKRSKIEVVAPEEEDVMQIAGYFYSCKCDI
jgi:hypothetical protein